MEEFNGPMEQALMPQEVWQHCFSWLDTQTLRTGIVLTSYYFKKAVAQDESLQATLRVPPKTWSEFLSLAEPPGYGFRPQTISSSCHSSNKYTHHSQDCRYHFHPDGTYSWDENDRESGGRNGNDFDYYCKTGIYWVFKGFHKLSVNLQQKLRSRRDQKKEIGGEEKESEKKDPMLFVVVKDCTIKSYYSFSDPIEPALHVGGTSVNSYPVDPESGKIDHQPYGSDNTVYYRFGQEVSPTQRQVNTPAMRRCLAEENARREAERKIQEAEAAKAKGEAEARRAPKSGDWLCPKCQFNNFASRTDCKNCGSSSKPASLSTGPTHKAGDWSCGHCRFHNFASRAFCKNCGKTKSKGHV
eukprot:gene17993-5683_t